LDELYAPVEHGSNRTKYFAMPLDLSGAGIVNLKNEGVLHLKQFHELVFHDQKLHAVGSIIEQISRYVAATSKQPDWKGLTIP
jgi:hypothetical protein